MSVLEAPFASSLAQVRHGISLATRERTRRQQARERIHARVAHALDTPRLMRDPLERPSSALRSTLTFARLLVVAAILHALILAIVFLGNRLVGSTREHVAPERLQVRIVAPRPPPPPEPIIPELPEPVAPRVVEPVKEPLPLPKPKRPAQVVPPDPVQSPLPPPPSEQPPTRRIVGISMESAVEGGKGPAFAVGSSRMGETGPRAVDPGLATREPAKPTPNRISTRFAEADAPIIPPRRLAPSIPVYPTLLREQGIEADVVVVVSIAPDGRVTAVEVIRPAPQQAFNDAAVAAARLERYAPATRAGQSIPYTQSYTIRFRLND